MCLFGAVERDDDNSLRRRVPIQAFCFTAPSHKMIMAVEGARVSPTLAPYSFMAVGAVIVSASETK